MVKPARSSLRKKKSVTFFTFLLPVYFLLIHFFNKDHTHTLQCQGCLLYLPACSFKSPVFQDHNSTQGVTVRRKALWFLLGWVRPKPPVLVPLPAFPPCDSPFSAQFCATPSLHSCVSCRQPCLSCCCRWRSCSISFLPLSSVSLSMERRHSSWGCSCWSYQRAKAVGWQHSGERRSTQKGLTSSAIRTNLLLPAKKKGFLSFWGPQRVFLHLSTAGEIGQNQTEPSSSPPSPPTEVLSSKDLCTIN